MSTTGLPVINGTAADRDCAILLDMDRLQGVTDVLNRAIDSHPFELVTMVTDLLDFLQVHDRIKHALIGFTHEQRDCLELFVSRNRRSRVQPAVHLVPSTGPIADVISTGEPLIAVRAGDIPGLAPPFDVVEPERPLIAVPIFMRGRSPSGVLVGQPPDQTVPLEGHAKFIGMVATLLGQSIQIGRTTDRERRELYEQRDIRRRADKIQHGFDSIVGATPVMQRLFGQVRLVAKWNTTVLIRGQSGTGKELIANAIHYNSPRADGNLVKLNCAALLDNLLESELFGHEKGAFTGALNQRKGRFEQADRGTLFLDEIGEISGAFQTKLLRVLQEGEFERVGGTKTLTVDVRIIAATNKNLEAAVEAGHFREDLYYRLNVMPLFMPALQERRDDIPDLARFLLAKIGKRQGRRLAITNGALRVLAQHDWPGNVRELENCLERGAVLSHSGTIDRETLVAAGLAGEPRPDALGGAKPAPALNEGPAGFNAPAAEGEQRFDDPDLDERSRVVAALEEAGWVQAKAARLLGMTPRQIAYRIQTLDIPVRRI